MKFKMPMPTKPPMPAMHVSRVKAGARLADIHQRIADHVHANGPTGLAGIVPSGLTANAQAAPGVPLPALPGMPMKGGM